jgi:hypothetical protein
MDDVPVLIMGWSTPEDGDEVVRCGLLLRGGHLLGGCGFCWTFCGCPRWQSVYVHKSSSRHVCLSGLTAFL